MSLTGDGDGLQAIMDYPAYLEAAWAQHLAPRLAGAPTVVSTFAGAGGSSLGFSMAGYHELLAVEWDKNAAETFRLNFPRTAVYQGDIARLSVEECMRMAGLTGPRQLSVLDGSPPCQGFSTSGSRVLDDPRNQLFREYVRLLRGLQPAAFVMENVSGMVKGKMKLVFAEIMRELKASGYLVSARLLNAMYFGVPQARERMIFIGVRADLGLRPSHPAPETRPIAASRAILGADTSDNILAKPQIAERMKAVRPGQNIKQAEGISAYFDHWRCPIGRPAGTLTKTIGSGVSLYHPVEHRNLSRGELMRISSFPDEFQFAGSYKNAVARMGNSVPPLFMRAIAGHIERELLRA